MLRSSLGTDAPAMRRVSVVIPCLNEAETIAECVRGVREVLDESQLDGEIVVVDNGSDDGSGELAAQAGATVVREPRRGYGSAYLAGLRAATGDYIVMLDADLTYDFREIPAFVRELDAGAQLVMGNRMGGIRPGAMSPLSRIGNPLLSGFLNLLYRTPARDVHCGMRALRRDALPALDLRTTGMEFASEMVIRAAREHLDVREIPIELHPRVGESKLSPFRDGWRHLRIILVYHPNFLFVWPGIVLFVLGAIVSVLVLADAPVLGRNLETHSLILGCLLAILGSQAIGFGICARAYNAYYVGGSDTLFERARAGLRLEHGLVLAAVLVLTGLGLIGAVFGTWASGGFGELGQEQVAIVAATVTTIGAQVFFTSFLLSILGLRWRQAEPW